MYSWAILLRSSPTVFLTSRVITAQSFFVLRVLFVSSLAISRTIFTAWMVLLPFLKPESWYLFVAKIVCVHFMFLNVELVYINDNSLWSNTVIDRVCTLSSIYCIFILFLDLYHFILHKLFSLFYRNKPNYNFTLLYRTQHFL